MDQSTNATPTTISTETRGVIAHETVHQDSNDSESKLDRV